MSSRRTWLVGLGIAASIVFGVAVATPWSRSSPRKNTSKAKPKAQKTKAKPGKKRTKPAVSRIHDRGVPPKRPAAPAGASNLVLVFGCTVRKDQTSVYSDLDTTPWLRTMANDGAVFDDALSVSSWTRASAIGVLTAQHPLAWNVPEPGRKQSERRLPADATLLAEHLAAAGWMTFGSTANPNLNATYGMAQGMDRYRDSSPSAFKRGRRSGKRVVNEALGMLDKRTKAERQRPFYLQLMLIDAHHPRRPDPTDIGALADNSVPTGLVRYRASLRQVDRALQQLDQGLRARNYTPENTFFVFVSDHGEGLDHPAHHRGGHGKKMYPSTVEIPWVVRGPGVPAGVHIKGLASGVDVSPTLLSLLDIPTKTPTGEDLAAWVQGHSTGNTPRTRAFSASMFHVADVAAIWTPTHQCQNHYAADRDKQVQGCFDRQADPGFIHPIQLPQLETELEATRTDLIERGQRYPIKRASIDDDVAEQLELLGYTAP